MRPGVRMAAQAAQRVLVASFSFHFGRMAGKMGVRFGMGGSRVLRGFIIREADGARTPVGTSLTLGRTSDCGFVIDDTAASRKHFEIAARRGTFVWRDLGSTNGTVVNGKRMVAGELRHGDRIQIGETTLRFEVEEAPDEAVVLDDGTMFRETVLAETGEVAKTLRQDKRATLLQAVYDVTNAIASDYEPCSLIDRILCTTMRAISAQRGALFFTGESGDLLPCPVCQHVHTIRDGLLRPRKPSEMRISSTVVGRVIDEGESVLFQATDADEEISVAKSVMAMNLRSILCVPLRAKTGILGILYIDSNRPNLSYTEEDLLLATSVGASAGLAIENARMHQEMLEKQRIEQEIATAWIIQEGFLVKDWPEDDPRIQVYGETRPAKTVGGDFYDFVQPDADTAGILIGDVSGKGVPAALTMAQLLAEFRLRARQSRSPAQVLAWLNEDLVQRSQHGMFCTMTYLVLELASGRVTCANAGHSPVLRLTDKGPVFFAEASAPPAGVLPELSLEEITITLAPGDALLLYTDGIIEARAAARDAEGGFLEYENTRLAQAAFDAYGLSPRDLLETVHRDVCAFCAPDTPHDDCTMISVKYLGQA